MTVDPSGLAPLANTVVEPKVSLTAQATGSILATQELAIEAVGSGHDPPRAHPVISTAASGGSSGGAGSATEMCRAPGVPVALPGPSLGEGSHLAQPFGTPLVVEPSPAEPSPDEPRPGRSAPTPFFLFCLPLF